MMIAFDETTSEDPASSLCHYNSNIEDEIWENWIGWYEPNSISLAPNETPRNMSKRNVATQTTESEPRCVQQPEESNDNIDETSCLPEFVEETNDKARLRNNLLSHLLDEGLGWSELWVERLGNELLDVVTDCLWYLEGSHHLFTSHSLCLPHRLLQIQRNNINQKNNNNSKNSRKRGHCGSFVSLDKLMEHSMKLLRLCEKNYMGREQWIDMRDDLLKMSVNMALLVQQVETISYGVERTSHDDSETSYDLDVKPAKRRTKRSYGGV